MKQGSSLKVVRILTSAMLLVASVSGIINSSNNLIAADYTATVAGDFDGCRAAAN